MFEVNSYLATYKADSHVIVNTKQDIVQKSLDVVEKLAQHGISKLQSYRLSPFMLTQR